MKIYSLYRVDEENAISIVSEIVPIMLHNRSFGTECLRMMLAVAGLCFISPGYEQLGRIPFDHAGSAANEIVYIF